MVKLINETKETDFFLDSYDYELPENLIAQQPREPRGTSRMMVIDRAESKFIHTSFTCLPEYLGKGDLLVMNRSGVFPARLFARRKTGGKIEVFLLRREDRGSVWQALIKPSRKINVGEELDLFAETEFTFDYGKEISKTSRCGYVQVIRQLGFGKFMVKLCMESKSPCYENELELINQIGNVPLPPYIQPRKEFADKYHQWYRTVYAKEETSVAAPTAGFHFTKDILDGLAKKGVLFAEVILDIGLGTFRPVLSSDIKQHHMEAEHYLIPDETCNMLKFARKNGMRIVAVGTTTVRALENYAQTGDQEAETGLFIYPGYRFHLTDALITNFHLPCSTLLMLVSAFAGREMILKAYREAIEHDYHFYSFGDVMFIS
jgi:S-adenosylmethionine:tRNA ribosyltransferase-isomerase